MTDPTNFREQFDQAAPEWEPREAGAAIDVGLALSGGGFRAMLFHVGALRRLHEVDALRHVHRISSVSGGSITAAVLAQAWARLAQNPGNAVVFDKEVQDRVFGIAGQRIDVSSGLRGLVTPRRSIAQSVAARYEKIFPGFRLQQLPDRPRFVFCSTNLGTGALVRFAKKYTADRTVGKRDALDLPMSQVIAASAAFPPVLSPMRIDLSDQPLDQKFPNDDPPLFGTGYAKHLELSDGGVYDNLGLQPLEKYHTVLVSDAGGPFEYDESVDTDWVRHMIRSWKVADNQVRSLRRKHLVADFKAGRRNGTFWGISTDYSDYPVRVLNVHDSWANYLKSVPTRLHRVDKRTRKQLINFSYCLTDAALRSYVATTFALRVPTLPYPEEPLDQPAPATYEAPPIWKVWK